jgi:lysophospholipase L1-like esterase
VRTIARDRAATAHAAASAPLFARRVAPRAAFIGDSFTEASQVLPAQSFVALVAKRFHWQPVNLGQGGTGYVEPGPPGLGRAPLPDRAARIGATRADYVVVAAGINDANRHYPASRIEAAVARTLDTIRRQLPRATVIVVGPFWPNGYPIPEIDQIDQEVKQAALARHLPFVDPIGERWITGTNDGLVKGNRSRYIGPDGTHPTVAGQAYIARRIEQDLTRLGIRPWVASP